jgi:hypothetical protein
MMQSTQDGHSNDGTRPLDYSMQWRILVQLPEGSNFRKGHLSIGKQTRNPTVQQEVSSDSAENPLAKSRATVCAGDD